MKMAAVVGGLVIGLVILAIVLFLIGVWLLFIGISDSVSGKFSFWSLLDIIVGFIMVFGGGGSLRSSKKT